ncbi:HEAT repeat domain-containing protein [Spelaeicoccus albus]|uniref:DNA-binding transcriptional MerR regulator n=1 Tax=Spelaeicoccus albus TaxID=1280376 RepID=A0A7Z0D1P2_9MICO|nr:HEAT repeat domain-containing protein [Spelaeicoccus albus]NYI66537.1 DNA-binding transcriptional MerR regulator [Spelaeicoccus albus]
MLIGEVARQSGISARMLRHYDSIGLVVPSARTASGYREYAEVDLQRLFHVETLRSFGLSLPEVGQALDDPDFAPARLVDELMAKTRQRITRERELLHRLEQVHASGPGGWDDILRIMSLMHGIQSSDPSRRQTSALSAGGDEAAGLADTLAAAVLAEDDLNVAGALRWALKQSGNESLPVLTAALESPDAEPRLRAVTMIAELGTDEANAVLAGTLEDADDAVRHKAAVVIGARGDRRAIPVLTAMVVDGDNDVEAAETLGSLAGRHGVGESIAGTIAGEIDNRHGEPGARLRLTGALAELSGTFAQPILEALTNDSDEDVARTAAYVLGRFRVGT